MSAGDLPTESIIGWVEGLASRRQGPLIRPARRESALTPLSGDLEVHCP